MERREEGERRARLAAWRSGLAKSPQAFQLAFLLSIPGADPPAPQLQLFTPPIYSPTPCVGVSPEWEPLGGWVPGWVGG